MIDETDDIECRLKGYRKQHQKYGYIPVFNSFQNMIDMEYLLSLGKRAEVVVEAASKYVSGHPYSNSISEDNGKEERNWDAMCNAVYNYQEKEE